MRTAIRRTMRRILRAVGRIRTLIQGDPRRDIAATYLKGSGIEIGALHNPLMVPAQVEVRYVDRMSVEDLRRHYPELEFEPLTTVDIIDDGERLSSLNESTQDFVIANHFLEHCENPLGALQNMIRVLKPGGVLYVAVPDKRFTFDRERPVTPFEHLSKDYVEGPEQSRRQHYEEWVEYFEKKTDRGEIEGRAEELMGQGYSIHFHVWTPTELLELFSKLGTLPGVRTDLELFLENKEEVIVVARKGS
jgi:SAM-dependent methyltransferase